MAKRVSPFFFALFCFVFSPTVYHCDLHLGLHLAGSVCLHHCPGPILIQHGADLPQHQHPS